MTWRASPSKCAPRRASSRPRNRRLPASCGARSMAWTKTISAPACNAARIGCVAATSPIRPKPPSPATCKSWVNRSATRLAPWAMLSTLPRTPRSTGPWTIYPVCATNSPASADVPTRQPGTGSARPWRPTRPAAVQTGQRSTAIGQSGQAGQRRSAATVKAVNQAASRCRWTARRVRSATASPVRWAIRPVARRNRDRNVYGRL